MDAVALRWRRYVLLTASAPPEGSCLQRTRNCHSRRYGGLDSNSERKAAWIRPNDFPSGGMCYALS